MAAPTTSGPRLITLSDLHPGGLSPAQARRIVALLGLARPRSSEQGDRKTPAA